MSFFIHLRQINACFWCLVAVFIALTACNQIPAREPAATQISAAQSEINALDIPAQFPSPAAPPTAAFVPRPTLKSPAADGIHSRNLNAALLPIATDIPISSTPQSSDLLFISNENLLRWDHVTNYTSVLVQDVIDYSASSSGKQLALLRPHNMVANGVELFDLAMLDLKSKRLVTILPTTSRLLTAISPDGQWVAYTGLQNDAAVYVISAAGLSQPISLGKCHASSHMHCTQLAWSLDSQTILWNDALGVWIAGVNKALPELIHPNNVPISDPKGNQAQLEVSFGQFSWSPLGRYVITQIAPSASNVSWYGLLDTRKGLIVEVPGSFETDTPLSSAHWTLTGELMMLQNSFSFTDQPAEIKIWQVVPTSNDMLILKKAYSLTGEGLVGSLPDGPTSQRLTWLAQPDPARLTFAVQQVETGNSILYEFNLEEGSLQFLLSLPYDASGLSWSPDGSGVLILGSSDPILYAPTDGSAPYNLLPVLGLDAHRFLWLPPNPRE